MPEAAKTLQGARNAAACSSRMQSSSAKHSLQSSYDFSGPVAKMRYAARDRYLASGISSGSNPADRQAQVSSGHVVEVNREPSSMHEQVSDLLLLGSAGEILTGIMETLERKVMAGAC